jgi:hypothetical protein
MDKNVQIEKDKEHDQIKPDRPQKGYLVVQKMNEKSPKKDAKQDIFDNF